MRNAVRPSIRRSIASRMAASVLASTALVGSSRIKSGASLRKARQRDALPLSAGELQAAFPDGGLVRLPQADDEVVCPGGCRRTLDLRGGRSGPPVGDVLADARREQHRLLEHDRELIPQIRKAILAEIDTVEQDRALGRVVEAGEQ